MAEKRQLKVSTRSLPKHLAGKLQDRMEKLRDDSTLLLPTCDHEGGCPRPSLERALRRVQKVSDSRVRLRRLSRRGTHLARAYAGALDLLFDETLPMLGGFPNPFGGGEVKYAQRGNAKKEVQAGVQNFSDKGVRLLAYLPYAKGFRGVYLFSTEDGMRCAGRVPIPPEAFLREAASAQRPALAKEGDDFACPHLRGLTKGLPREGDETHLAAKWARSSRALKICALCAGGGNLSAALRKYAIGPKVPDQVEAWVELRPQCNETGADACHFDQRIDLTDGQRKDFGAGKLTDADAIAAAMKRAVPESDSPGDGFVLAGGVCYGKDTGAIVDGFDPSAEMRRALKAALADLTSDVVLDALTPSKVLSKFWPDRAVLILEAACGNPAVAKQVEKEAKANEAPPALIQRAVKLARAAAVEEALPAFEGLSAEAAMADKIARAHRRGGAEAALREVEAGRNMSPSAGAVAWAFLKALDKSGGREWQFTKVEMDRGAVATKDARALLDCRSDDYEGALRRALEALGIHETIEATTT